MKPHYETPGEVPETPDEVPEAMGDTIDSPTAAPAVGRIAGLDALRGVMLTIVLADHCSGMLAQGRFIRQWTLMGLGWSDAAEAFVFLSGLTFGWVYSARLERRGAWTTLRLGLRRSLQLYLAYLLTVLAVVVMDVLQQENMWPALAAAVNREFFNTLLMRHHPYSIGILCLYVVCLPYTVLMFVTFGRAQSWLYFSISYGLYSLVQIFPWINLPADHGFWYFNPFAWQLLMSVGALLGREARAGQARLPRSSILCAAACTVVALGLLQKKGDLILGPQTMNWLTNAIAFDQWQQLWLEKTLLSPLRLLHFASLAYLLAMLAPLRHAIWSHWAFAPLRICGRNSLAVYCIGVLLTHSLRLLPPDSSDSPLKAALLVVILCVAQCVIAALLEFAAHGNRRVHYLTEPPQAET